MDGSSDSLRERLRERFRRTIVNPRIQKIAGLFSIVFGMVVLIGSAVTLAAGGDPGWNGWCNPIFDIFVGLYLLDLSRRGGEPTGRGGERRAPF